MKRLVARLSIGLITFVIGVAIASIGFRREFVKSPPLVEQQESLPLRLGIFIEADGVIIAWPDRARKFTWINGDECRVPEKYLSVLEEMNAKYNAPLIKRFHKTQQTIAVPGFVSQFESCSATTWLLFTCSSTTELISSNQFDLSLKLP